jgi:hypothetical protein
MARTSSLPTQDAAAAPTLPDAARVAGWGLVFWGAVQVASTVFARNATAALAVQAALAEWGAGRMAIAWSDPLAPLPTWRQVGARAGRGAALGGAAAGLVVVAGLVTGAGTFAERSLGLGLLGVGLVSSLLSAVRDELLLRGVVLRAIRGLLPWWAAVLACGGGAAAARFGLEGVVGLGLLVEGLRGVALGALWVRDRGAWMAIAANAAWSWILGSVVRGGLVDIRFTVEGDVGLGAAVVMLAAAAGATLWATRRT